MASGNVDLGGIFSNFLLDLVRSIVEQVLAERSGQQEPAGPYAFDRKAAAEFLGVSPTTLDGLRAKGLIKEVRVEGMPRFRRKDLQRYIDNLAEAE